MKLCIHRGTKEIGGSCVEITTKTTRIIVDFGMPLVNKDGSEFDFKNYESDSVADLIRKKVLPDIKGLYDDSTDNPPDALFISHPHIDHYGFSHFINKDIPIYLGEITKRIIELTGDFTGKPFKIKKPRYIQEQKLITIGDIKIIPYYNDHSAIDSYGFLIEADGKKIYYTGDFRAHGKNPEIFNTFKKYPPSDIACLLMEGTTISRPTGKEKTEKQIESELTDLFRQYKINLVYSSGQNIDRLLAIYDACKSAGKIFVIDFYIANILRIIHYNRDVPFPSAKYPDIKVMYPLLLSDRLVNFNQGKYLYAFRSKKIKREEIDENPGNYVMTVRPSMMIDLRRMKNIDGGNIIYSLWSGYLKKEYTANFIDYLKKRKFDFHEIHTSGHADVDTLKEMVRIVKPKVLIPIHTFEPDKYKTVFKVPVKELKDGEDYEV